MFVRVAKIPIANTFNELVEMDFADYGGSCDIFAHPGYFSRFSAIVFFRNEEKVRTNSGNGQGAMISNWVAVFGAPEILMMGKDKRFTGWIFQDFVQIVI